MKIQVKRKHIQAGIPGDEEACPVLWACKEAGLPIKSANIVVSHLWEPMRGNSPSQSEMDGHEDQAFLETYEGRMVFLTKKLGKWMSDFDAGKPVKPIEFMVKL